MLLWFYIIFETQQKNAFYAALTWLHHNIIAVTVLENPKRLSVYATCALCLEVCVLLTEVRVLHGLCGSQSLLVVVT